MNNSLIRVFDKTHEKPALRFCIAQRKDKIYTDFRRPPWMSGCVLATINYTFS
jgi:hypothetical protein